LEVDPDNNDCLLSRRVLTDAVEKVRGTSDKRNNKIINDDLLHRTCALDARIDSILLREPPQNLFSTASVHGRRSGTTRADESIERAKIISALTVLPSSN
jgi:hypothetical protein